MNIEELLNTKITSRKRKRDESVLDIYNDPEKWEKLNPKERRRIRNLITARDARQKSKNELIELQREFTRLQNENQMLRNQLSSDTEVSYTYNDLIAAHVEAPIIIKNALQSLYCSEIDDFSIEEVCERLAYSVVSTISSCATIVHASEPFCTLTGVERHEVMGLNGLFAQVNALSDVKDSLNQQILMEMQDAITKGKDMKGFLFGRRRNGETFFVNTNIVHLKDTSGQSFLAIIIHREVPDDLLIQMPSSPKLPVQEVQTFFPSLPPYVQPFDQIPYPIPFSVAPHQTQYPTNSIAPIVYPTIGMYGDQFSQELPQYCDDYATSIFACYNELQNKLMREAIYDSKIYNGTMLEYQQTN